MTISTYRYGTPRLEGEGLRIGVARQVPRGVRKEDWKPKGYFDLRAIQLAPSQPLVHAFRHGEIDFPAFTAAYRAEMSTEAAREAIDTAATLALYQPISLGCFCKEESRCHRSILRELIANVAQEKEAAFRERKGEGSEPQRLTSPVCYADDLRELHFD